MEIQSCTVYRGGQGEVIEKKSRFIATIEPAASEDEALRVLERLRKKYWDASHHCYAYIIGQENSLMRCSDDGEPAQTAGRPILDVLTGASLHNVIAVVTRYFGGTLLGTGGLVRAYSRAVQEGLAQSVVIEKHPGYQVILTCDYTDVGKIQYLLAQNGISTLNSVYTDTVTLQVLFPRNSFPSRKADIMEATGGRTGFSEPVPVTYADLEGEILLLDQEM